MTEPSQTEKAVAFLESIETGDEAPLAYAGAYRQHNLGVPDGVAGLVAVLGQLPAGSARVKTVRAFADGDYVVTHTDYDFFGPKVGFDVFRFENGKIAEHWDNLQEKPSTANPSGHTMLDGPTEIVNLGATEANKQLVRGFVEDVLLGGHMDRLPRYTEGDRYVQHNPQIGDGLAALGGALESLAAAGNAIQYDKLHKVLGQGNFVLVMSEGSFGATPTAYYDLFRVEKGKIVEHWDVIQAIPPKAEWQHENGKF